MLWLRNVKQWTGLRTMQELMHTIRNKEQWTNVIANSRRRRSSLILKMDSFYDEIPQEIIDEATEASSHLVPERSRKRYHKEFMAFDTWCTSKKVKFLSMKEEVFLGYFNHFSKRLVSIIKCERQFSPISINKSASHLNASNLAHPVHYRGVSW